MTIFKRAVLILACAGAAAAIILNITLYGRLKAVQSEAILKQNNAAETLHQLEKEKAVIEEALERAESDKSWLESELEKLRQSIAEAGAAVAPEVETGTEDDSIDLAALISAFDLPENTSSQTAQAEEQSNRQLERLARAQAKLADYYEKRIENTQIPEEADRLAALRDYTSYLMDLRSQLHEAQTDAEKEAIRAEIRAAVKESRMLLHEQQQFMLDSLAEEFGVRGAQRQKSFATEIRRTMNSPFFRMDNSKPGNRNKASRQQKR